MGKCLAQCTARQCLGKFLPCLGKFLPCPVHCQAVPWQVLAMAGGRLLKFEFYSILWICFDLFDGKSCQKALESSFGSFRDFSNFRNFPAFNYEKIKKNRNSRDNCVKLGGVVLCTIIDIRTKFEAIRSSLPRRLTG